MSPEYIVFTDLDGSLLDHADYCFDAALPMLEYLKSHRIPLIYTTSKTRKECLLLQEKMGIDAPFIVENGAAVVYPDGSLDLLGRPHEQIVGFVRRYRDKYAIHAFCDMSVEEIMQRTGFGPRQAKLAKVREFSEPFVLDNPDTIDALKEAAQKEGFAILRGGRFYHCVGAGQDKGRAVQKVLEKYPQRKSIALGDNFNDTAMLDVVDIPILIPRYSGDYIPYQRAGLIKAPYPGSRGWAAALAQVLGVAH